DRDVTRRRFATFVRLAASVLAVALATPVWGTDTPTPTPTPLSWPTEEPATPAPGCTQVPAPLALAVSAYGFGPTWTPTWQGCNPPTPPPVPADSPLPLLDVRSSFENAVYTVSNTIL